MFSEEGSTARWMVISAMAWMAIAISLGFVQAIEFVAPDFAKGIHWLVFSRIRQAHVNGLLFGWISMGMIACWYYIVPLLTGRKIYSEVIGNVVMLLWNASLFIGVVGIVFFGWTQAREYAELAWPIDIAIMVGLILTAYNIFKTISARNQKLLYVSNWYIMGSLLWFPIVYAIGNVIWNPSTGSLTGLNDAIWGWFYGHNVLGLWFTTGVIGILYYVIPREIKQPLYGYSLALMAFWLLAFFYTGVGTHHILQSPVPEWLKSVAVISSVGLFISVAAFTTNIFMTMRGSWRVLQYSFPLRFAVMSVVWYLLVSLQGSTQALREVNQWIHFTNWTIAHAHLALLGFASFGVMAGIYYMIPRMCGNHLYSDRLASAHWWMTVLGFVGFFSVLAAAGLTQASEWARGIPTSEVVASLRPYYIARAASGAVIITGQLIFVYNIARTMLDHHSKREAVLFSQDKVPADVVGA
ncbi:MAG: cbb3-type cytochrome c oxidase subunit I [Firmicutes bacterium]|nr:cbb3-type cytochrome c oxidase subunit I [Bacillota bacterium]